MKNIKILIIVAILLINSACTKDDKGGLSKNACGLLRSNSQGINTKIIDGTQCSVNGSPIVSISVLLESGDVGLCSGTVIAPRHILTAAHCFDVDTVGEVLSSSVQIEGFNRSIRRITIHPRVNIPQNDVAIIELQEPTSVNPVPLILSSPVNPGDVISIFGYGFDENSNFATLKSGQMRVTGVTSQNIFARFSEGTGSNVCFGDSGGPAILDRGNGTLGIVGITSFATSEGCIEDGFSGFANVQSNDILDFIFDVVPNAGGM